MDRKILFALLGVLVFIIGSSAVALAPSGGKPEPLPSSNFIVEIDGITIASYASVEGVTCGTEVVEYRDGSDPNRVMLLPGLTRYGPITLRRGLTENTELWDWYKGNLENPTERKSMSIVFMDHGHNEKARYNAHECWPSDYYIEPLESNPSDVAMEVIVIQTELIERA
ncbi:MAG: phage tail protein [Thermoplasmata archaeon]|nr:MAG: phage tail protein [Thermoplasmata archaeon]